MKQQLRHESDSHLLVIDSGCIESERVEERKRRTSFVDSLARGSFQRRECCHALLFRARLIKHERRRTTRPTKLLKRQQKSASNQCEVSYAVLCCGICFVLEQQLGAGSASKHQWSVVGPLLLRFDVRSALEQLFDRCHIIRRRLPVQLSAAKLQQSAKRKMKKFSVSRRTTIEQLNHLIFCIRFHDIDAQITQHTPIKTAVVR